jgi:hypothetical protein
MKKETLERLLNEACELLIIFEDGNVANDKDKLRISAIFNEIKYADEIDNELALTLSERIGKEADDEAQDWSVFGDNKI